MLDHLRPQYARNFRCTGSASEENCCRGWDVIVDRPSYRKYEANPTLQPVLQECFKLITDHPNETKHAVIKYRFSSICPFLSAERLCRLQQEYGDDYLCVTCATYPRVPRKIESLCEHALSLSCIEAARLVLLDPQLTPANENAEEARYTRFIALKEKGRCANDSPMRYFWDTREFCLLLVQDRSYLLRQRLFFLGMFCKRLDEILSAGGAAADAQDAGRVRRNHCAGNLRTAMDDIPARVTVQLEMLMQVVFGYLVNRDPRLSRIHECLQDFLLGLGYESAPYLDTPTHKPTIAITVRSCGTTLTSWKIT
jgi:lysine-N-methylase